MSYIESASDSQDQSGDPGCIWGPVCLIGGLILFVTCTIRGCNYRRYVATAQMAPAQANCTTSPCTYSFNTSGRTYFGTSENIRAGQAIQVMYLPDDPHQSKVVGDLDDFYPDGPLLLVVGAGLTVAGAFVVGRLCLVNNFKTPSDW